MGKVMLQRGVSLVEALASLVVFLLAVMGWMSVEAVLAQNAAQSHVSIQAMYIAQSKLEELNTIQFEHFESISPVPEYYDESGNKVTASSFYTLTYTVSTESLGDNLISDTDNTHAEIVITVTWNLFNDFHNTVVLHGKRMQ